MKNRFLSLLILISGFSYSFAMEKSGADSKGDQNISISIKPDFLQNRLSITLDINDDGSLGNSTVAEVVVPKKNDLRQEIEEALNKYSDQDTLDRHLVHACKDKELDLIEPLLKKGANPNGGTTLTFPLYTPILYAVLHGDVEAVKILLKHGADSNLFNFNALKNPLLAAVSNYSSLFNFSALQNSLLAPVSNYMAGKDVRTEENRKTIVHWLLLHNAAIESSSTLKSLGSPRVIATKNGYSEIATLLANYDQLKAKVFAAIMNAKKRLNELAVNEQEKALEIINGGRKKLKKLALKITFGIAIANEKDIAGFNDLLKGNNPLHMAIISDIPEIIGMILSINPLLIAMKNDAGKTPVDIVFEHSRFNTLWLFAGLAAKK